jgi:hypothetical protein
MHQWSEFCSTAGQAYQSEMVKLSNIGTATVHELTRVMHPDAKGIKA